MASAVTSVQKTLRRFLKDRKLWKPAILLCGIFPMILILFYWCHISNSLALVSFTYLVLFDLGGLIVYMVSVFTAQKTPNNEYSYGYKRANVVTVFSVTVVLILGGLVLVKHCLERLFDPPSVAIDNLFYGLFIGLAIHIIIQISIDNQPLHHATEVATPNWLQNALGDLGQSICGLSPPIGRLLLYRINPITLLVSSCSVSLFIAKVLIDLDDLHLADVAAAIFNSALICGTMLPLSIYCGKILLQTAPVHILPLLDKSLREASTLDGVLEFKNEHFWTISFGSYAGSLQVRVRRDADEQEVLKKVTSCLSSQLDDLTVQIVKDDWNIPITLSRSSPTTTPILLPNMLRPNSAGTFQSTATSTTGPPPQNHSHH